MSMRMTQTSSARRRSARRRGPVAAAHLLAARGCRQCHFVLMGGHRTAGHTSERWRVALELANNTIPTWPRHNTCEAAWRRNRVMTQNNRTSHGRNAALMGIPGVTLHPLLLVQKIQRLAIPRPAFAGDTGAASSPGRAGGGSTNIKRCRSCSHKRQP